MSRWGGIRPDVTPSGGAARAWGRPRWSGPRGTVPGVRVRAVVVAVVAVAAVWWPVVRQPQVDGFPLSNYPMFTQLRPRMATIDLAVGVDDEGRDVRLAPHLVGGTIEVIQAASTVGRSIREGSTGSLCDEVADRVARAGRTEVVEVVIATDHHDVVEALVRSGPPVRRVVHARCEVPW
jgi:hypothetical protein